MIAILGRMLRPCTIDFMPPLVLYFLSMWRCSLITTKKVKGHDSIRKKTRALHTASPAHQIRSNKTERKQEISSIKQRDSPPLLP